MAWSRVCAPKAEGGLGIRSLAAMNQAFLFRLARDILTQDSVLFGLLRSRFFNSSAIRRLNYISSSVWVGVRHHIDTLQSDSRWLVGQGTRVSFWWDNWLGTIIADRVGIPSNLRYLFSQQVSDYYYDGAWHFSADFVIQCLFRTL